MQRIADFAGIERDYRIVLQCLSLIPGKGLFAPLLTGYVYFKEKAMERIESAA